MIFDSRPILIMAGGTGGHVYPALAVAKELNSKNIPVVWMGTRKGLEARVVPEAGIKMMWLSISGLRGKDALTLLLAPFRLLLACWQAALIILRVKPRLVLGMGGFTTGPGGLMCKLLRCPLVIHEQNAIAGVTNRILSHLADSVLEAFPGTFKKSLHAYHTGNPVRNEISLLPVPEQRLGCRQGRLHLLVIGGSQGARFLNEIVPQAIRTMPEAIRPEIRHQAGHNACEKTATNYQGLGIKAEVIPFLDDMAAAYTWADLVIARSGAMTVAELAAAGLPAILVPFPHAVDDHQTANARFLAQRDAALIAQQTELSPERLGDWLSELAVDRERLLNMARRAREVARPEATQLVVQECLAVAESF
ncbi:MAG: undecaprenyldiphospho-muramoylpentapeptide beta-N-acetylglucosaminyltransferase [Gammaproteobacteria bacterium]|nr:undecaprenyldiphospho-muramoylpentapeptide beta-N-acetylglucosaminyltransferase [Gammaproteobacteria bacterium]